MTLADRLSRFRPGPAATRRIGPIGVVLGPDRLSLFQFDRTQGQTEIRAATAIDWAPDSPDGARQLRSQIRATLRRHRFHGRHVVAALPGGEVTLRVLNYVSDSRTSDPEKILALLKERFDTPLDQCVVDYLPIRSSKGDEESSALVAVANREGVLNRLALLESAGLRVDAIDIVPAALRRLVVQLSPNGKSDNTLLLNCGGEASNLTVLSGRRLLLYRDLDFSEQRTLEQLSRSLELEVAEAIAMIAKYGVFSKGDAPEGPAVQDREITRTISQIVKPSFYTMAEHIDKAAIYTASKSRGSGINQVYLLGPVAHWPGAGELLASLLSYPVHLLDLGDMFASEHDRELIAAAGLDVDFALAAGLALRGFGDG